MSGTSSNAPEGVKAESTGENVTPSAPVLIARGQRLFDESKFDEAACARVPPKCVTIQVRAHMACSELLSQAVEQQISEYGEMAVETVDAVIAYGKALLRHAVASSGVLGGASTNGAAPQPEQPPAAGPSQPASTSAPKNPNFHFGGDAEDEPEDAPAENEEGEQQQMEGQAGAEEEKEDDLENAFQMLDMARAILSKVDSSEAKLKLAGVHNALGEIATESERFADAAAEYLSALDVSSQVLPAHDRKIAEIHLMIALSYEFVPSTTKDINTAEGEAARQKAVEHAELAKKVLLMRRDYLQSPEKKEGEPSQEEARLELNDIAEVLEELEAKIEDLKSIPEDTAQAERNQQIDAALGVMSQAAANAPVNDLASMGLVKKRKPGQGSDEPAAKSEAEAKKEGETEEGESPNKKTKVDA